MARASSASRASTLPLAFSRSSCGLQAGGIFAASAAESRANAPVS